MKKTLCAVALLALLLVPGCNSDSVGGRLVTWLVGHKETRKEVVARVDKDADGKVSADELAMSGLDANKDGILQASEIDAGKQETEGSGLPGLILGILTTLGVPGAYAAKTILDQKRHVRALVAGIEEIKEAYQAPVAAGGKDPVGSWEDVRAILKGAAEEHTNPAALNSLVQKITAKL